MKMTMHIDDNLLAAAMNVAGVSSKTAAVDLALREFVRRGELVRALEGSPDWSPAELKAMFDPEYDLAAMRLAETPRRYGRKPGSH
ncbi:MAG: type II toxin-antitoxin system VapB family antitoxin [Verrucomicrobiales bacterium]|nr:type II toxin-antitoxin system VapB family antitoxin [Verrucomicrobiales bacterium]MCP5527930.1 type II toxin-antitoxin system VapB family antitoxin [Verrucomicrobiales bacterium]